MMDLSVKRLGVMRILDTTGVIDRYVYHYLDAMREVADRIMVFCANKTDDATITKLEKYANYIFRYDNINFSDGCFVAECSYELMKEYDEVVFFDDTCYGPFFSLQIFFERAEQRELDFWTLTKKYESASPEGEAVPGTLQDYFIVLRKKVIRSDFFAQYWNGVEVSPKVIEEMLHALETEGFYGDSCVDTSISCGRFSDENYDPTIWFAYDLLKYQKLPVVRTYAVNNTYFLPGGEEVPKRVFQYIKNKTDYDISLIWEHLLRTNNIRDIMTSLHLERILPNNVERESGLDISSVSAAVIAHVYYDDLLSECMEYIEEIPECIHVYIVSANRTMIDEIKRQIIKRKLTNCFVREKNNRGRDFSALLVACGDILLKYNYLCFVHDKKSHAHMPIPSGKTWFYNLWGCMLNSNGYIQNIIDTFENNPCLGLLVPPEPYHSGKIGCIGRTWGKDFDITQELLMKLGVEVPLERELSSITLGTAFWCRTKALKPLFEQNYRYMDFPDEPLAFDGTICHALERSFAYIAQKMGYYTEYVMPPELAALRMTNMTTYLTQAMDVMRELGIYDRQDGGIVFDIDKDRKRFEYIDHLQTFAYRHKIIYIWGSGKYGQECYELLQTQGIQIAAFIVTKKEGNQDSIMGVPIKSFDEIELTEGVGIIVALKRAFRVEVIPILDEFKDVDITYYPKLG